MSLDFPITGIGSLPHHNVDSALDYSFKHDIPFLPQLPILNKKEFMIQQALFALPGLVINEKNEARVDLKKWLKDKNTFEQKLDKALQNEDYSEFGPNPEVQSAFNSFVFECEEKSVPMAKIQLSGPLTAQIVTQLTDGDGLSDYPDLLSHCYKTVLIQALAMNKELIERGIKPLFFVDEPGLYAYSLATPLQMTAFEELRLMLLSLQKQGAKTGLHCCANTDWVKVLGLPLDYISFDWQLSAGELFKHRSELLAFSQRGGSLSLGIIPTHFNSQIEMPPIFDLFKDFIVSVYKDSQDELKSVLQGALITPACGLAYKTPDDAEHFLSRMREFQTKLTVFISSMK